MNFLSRRSIRKYTDVKIEEEKIKDIMGLATVAPSGKNKKPYQFIVISDKEMLKKLVDVKAKGIQMIEGASHGVVVLGEPESSDTWIEDCSIATMLIQLKAWELGIGSCWIQIREREDANGISSEKRTKELLTIPNELRVLAVVSLGYPDEMKQSYTEPNMEYGRIHSEKY